MTEYIKNNFEPNYLLNNKRLSKKNLYMLTKFAMEAHEIDPSKPISFYFEMFNQKLQEKYTESLLSEEKKISNFFKDEVIET